MPTEALLKLPLTPQRSLAGAEGLDLPSQRFPSSFDEAAGQGTLTSHVNPGLLLHVSKFCACSNLNHYSCLIATGIGFESPPSTLSSNPWRTDPRFGLRKVSSKMLTVARGVDLAPLGGLQPCLVVSSDEVTSPSTSAHLFDGGEGRQSHMNAQVFDMVKRAV
jgi:hypothetical protein